MNTINYLVVKVDKKVSLDPIIKDQVSFGVAATLLKPDDFEKLKNYYLAELKVDVSYVIDMDNNEEIVIIRRSKEE